MCSLPAGLCHLPRSALGPSRSHFGTIICPSLLVIHLHTEGKNLPPFLPIPNSFRGDITKSDFNSSALCFPLQMCTSFGPVPDRAEGARRASGVGAYSFLLSFSNNECLLRQSSINNPQSQIPPSVPHSFISNNEYLILIHQFFFLIFLYYPCAMISLQLIAV